MRRTIAGILILLLLCSLSAFAETIPDREHWTAFEVTVTDTDLTSEAERVSFCRTLVEASGLSASELMLGMLSSSQGMLIACNVDGKLADLLFYRADGVNGEASYWISDVAYSADVAERLLRNTCEQVWSID